MTDEALERIKKDSNFKFSNTYGMYINKDATLVYCLDLRGGYASSWRVTKVKVDEYTGYRYINYHRRRLSVKRILQDAWGFTYELPPLSSPPCYRETYNNYRKRMKHNDE